MFLRRNFLMNYYKKGHPVKPNAFLLFVFCTNQADII